MRGHDLPRKEKKRNKVLLFPSCSSIQTREQSYGENLFLSTKLLSKGEMNITKDDFLRIARSTIETFSPIFFGGERVKGGMVSQGEKGKFDRENDGSALHLCVSLLPSTMSFGERLISGSPSFLPTIRACLMIINR